MNDDHSPNTTNQSKDQTLFCRVRREKTASLHQKPNENDVDVDDCSTSTQSCACSSVSSTIKLGLYHSLHEWKIVAFGQFISFLVFGSAAATSELEEKCSLNYPAFQSSFTYFLLMFNLLVRVLKFQCSRPPNPSNPINDENKKRLRYSHEVLFHDIMQRAGENSQENAFMTNPKYFPFACIPIEGDLWVYFLLAFLEVEALYFTVLAYRYTTITSASLLLSMSVPSAMAASKILLKWKYGLAHIIGVCICLIGAVSNVLIDFEDDEKGKDVKFEHKVIGDFLATVGAVLLGVTDALVEFMCKKCSSQEYLSMMGIFGTIISIVQVFLVEKEAITMYFGNNAICSKEWKFGLLAAFTLANYLNLTLQAYFLRISEASLMNLSVLTSDLFAVLFSVVFENIVPDPLFYLALVLIYSGIIIYESAPSPMEERENTEETSTNRHCKDMLENSFDIKILTTQSFIKSDT